MIKDNGTYYRFTKDEGGGGTGCSDIIQEKSASLTAVDLPGQPVLGDAGLLHRQGRRHLGRRGADGVQGQPR